MRFVLFVISLVLFYGVCLLACISLWGSGLLPSFQAAAQWAAYVVVFFYITYILPILVSLLSWPGRALYRRIRAQQQRNHDFEETFDE